MKAKQAFWMVGALLASIVSLTSSAAESKPVDPARAAPAWQGGAVHKVLAPPGLFEPPREGIELWQDYGSFGLYRVTSAALAALPAEILAVVQVADDMDLIQLDAYTFNPRIETPRLPEGLALAENAGPGLELVQFVGPIKPTWLETLQAAGARPVHYVANNAYLVWTEAGSRSRLEELVQEGDFLQYRTDYQPYFKLGGTLRERLAGLSEASEVVPVAVQMIRHSGSEASEAAISGMSLGSAPVWTPVQEFQHAEANLRIADIPAVARLPDVTWVGERLERELLDEVQGQILAFHLENSLAGPGGPGYLAWLEGLGFSRDPSDYPIVDITDDGIGDGSLDTGDPTLHVEGQASSPARLAYLLNCTSAADGGSPDGHGHLNASIAAGYDTRSGFPYLDAQGFQLGLGINPFGRLGGTRVFTTVYDIGQCGKTDVDVIRASYTAGARIGSNSWGCSECASTYDPAAQMYDAGVRDADPYQPGNQQMTFVFAAGNGGRLGPGRVGSPGHAKNVITVGASESFRPYWTDGCSVSPNGADHAMDIIDFSSRGPAPGSRAKPDLVAPGTHIQGTTSPNSGYSGKGVCDPYNPTGQTSFAASSGTSHSTPAAAGVASLFTYWLDHTHHLTDPSPAMLKAYLLAHTTYLTGTGAGDTLPSNSQGYGMPNLTLAFDATPRVLVDQTVTLNHSGETWRFNGGVADPSQPVRIVLAFTDQPGLPGTSPQVNDLDLKVALGDETYLGNHFQNQWSVAGGAPDRNNNSEAVFLPAGVQGSLDITVTAYNIAGDGIPNTGDGTDQDFALVCYNCREVIRQDVCAPGEASYTLQVDPLPGQAGPVALAARGLPDGVLAIFEPNPVNPPGETRLVVSNTGAAAPGNYTIEVISTSPEQAQIIASLELNLNHGLPEALSLNTPAFAAVNQPARPNFTWPAASPGSTYEIEVAAGPDFSQASLSATGLDSPAFTPFADLAPVRLYFWRARARNACGPGGYSSTYTFVTAPTSGECSLGSAPQFLYSEDFESGVPGWSHSGSGDSWALSGERIHSGLQSYRAVDPPQTSDQQLVSPPVALPGNDEQLSLRFWNYQSIEDRTSNTCYDGGILEISADNGQNWSQVGGKDLLAQPYTGLIKATSNPLNGLAAWCGDPQDWSNTLVDLEAYRGQTVQFRFRLGSDNSVGREGWFIDDLAVQSCSPSQLLALLGPDSSLRGRPGERLVHQFLLRNLGLSGTFDLTVDGTTWPAVLSTPATLELPAGGLVLIPVEVSLPSGPGREEEIGDSFTLKAVPAGDAQQTLAAQGMSIVSALATVLVGSDQTGTGEPGGEARYLFAVKNTGDLSEQFGLAWSGTWTADLSRKTTGVLAPGESVDILLTVHIPPYAKEGDREVTALRVFSSGDGRIFKVAYAVTAVGSLKVMLPFVGRK